MTGVQLPTVYPGHPYATEEARTIAQDGLILLAEVGSGVHGTALPGTDDRDEMGVCLEPPSCVTGLGRFEQFERHTAWDRGGLTERSRAGDLDVMVYGARKFCRLALAGNPTILTLLFTQDEAIVWADELGQELLGKRSLFVSLSAASRYLGYLRAQRGGMTGRGRVNRPELIEQYGYDTKFAGHAVRLGVQGHELISTGWISLPMTSSWREYILAIRRGEVPLANVMETVDWLETRLRHAREVNPAGLPDQPNRVAVDAWLHRAHTAGWSRQTVRG